MELRYPITRKLRVLVGGVTKEELAAGVDQIAAELPVVGDGVVGVDLQPVLRDAGKLVARPYTEYLEKPTSRKSPGITFLSMWRDVRVTLFGRGS